MPAEILDRANPQALPSHIPDSVTELLVKLEKTKLEDGPKDGLAHFRRAACYIAAGNA
jgi:xylulose-5-phosphate/fructose-6-phosphate phosphoketolase